MKKEMLSLNGWIGQATELQQPLDEFLLDYNMRQLECSGEDILAKMQEMLDVMEKSVEHGLTGVRSHSGLTGGDAKSWLMPVRAILAFWGTRPGMLLFMLLPWASVTPLWGV